LLEAMPERFQRLVLPPGEREIAREVVERVGVVGIGRDRLLRLGDRSREVLRLDARVPNTKVEIEHRALDPEEAPQLVDRGWVVDPEVDVAAGEAGGAALPLAEEQRRGLHAARVAAALLPLDERSPELLREGAVGRLEAPPEAVDDRLAREDVPLRDAVLPR